MFNDDRPDHSKKYQSETDLKVLEMTGNSRVIYHGDDTITWDSELSVDSLIVFFTKGKLPVPSITYQGGVEFGHREYEFKIGTQLQKSFGDGYGSIDVYSFGEVNWIGETRWLKHNADHSSPQRQVRRLCIGGDCSVRFSY